MRMHATRTLLAAALLACSAAAFADGGRDALFAAMAVNDHPATVHEVRVDDAGLERYARLASRIGLDYAREYRYREWADIKRAHDVGVAGAYEWLACSTGDGDTCPAGDAAIHWESMYYGNHDLTVLYRVRTHEDRTYVRLLKLAEGRVPDLHNLHNR